MLREYLKDKTPKLIEGRIKDILVEFHNVSLSDSCTQLPLTYIKMEKTFERKKSKDELNLIFEGNIPLKKGDFVSVLLSGEIDLVEILEGEEKNQKYSYATNIQHKKQNGEILVTYVHVDFEGILNKIY